MLGRVERAGSLVSSSSRPTCTALGASNLRITRDSPINRTMGMFATGRQRRIAWRLVQPRFEFGDLCQQQANDGLSLRRLPGNDIFRDLRLVRHAACVADFSRCAKTNFESRPTPECERLLPVRRIPSRRRGLSRSNDMTHGDETEQHTHEADRLEVTARTRSCVWEDQLLKRDRDAGQCRL